MSGESLPVQRLLFWDEKRPALPDLVALSPDQLTTIADFVEEKGFSSGFSDTLVLASSLGASHERTLDLLRYIGFLNDQRRQFSLSADEMIQEFDLYARRKDLTELGSSLPAVQGQLLRLFGPHPKAELRAKIEEVTASVLPTGVSFSSLCDLRPVFNEERDAIVEYVVAALIRIEAHDPGGDEASLVFQLDGDGLAELEKSVAHLRRKWDVLSAVKDKLTAGGNQT